MEMRTLSFAEDFCLLMLDDASGSLYPLQGRTMDFGFAAAILLELAQHNRIETEPDSLSVVDASPIGDPVADPVLAQVASSERSGSPEYWVQRIGLQSGLQIAETSLDRLVERGILEQIPGDLFFPTAEVARSRRYPEATGRGVDEVRVRVMRALFSGEVPDSWDADLIGLAEACGVFRLILSTAEFDKIRGRIEQMEPPHPLCRAAQQVAADDLAAKKPSHREFEPIPEVPGLPILGNALGMSGDLQAYLDGLYKQYGPIFSLRAPGHRIVVMGGKEAIAFAMKYSQTHLRSNRSFADFCDAMETERSIISMDGHDHIKLRRLAHAGYARMKVADNLSAVIDVARRVVASWPVGRPLSVYPAMQEIAIPQLGVIATGLAPTEFVNDLRYWFDSLVIAMRHDRPKFMLDYRLRKVRPRIKELFRQAVERHDPQRRAGCPRDLIDEFLDIHKRDPQFLPETDLISSVVAPYIQALDPIAGTLGFALLRLLAEPRYAEMLQHEADEAFAAGLVDAASIRGLEMTYAFLAEIMRCRTITPVILRTACNSFEFEGHWVPAGTSLWLAPGVVHTDPDYYPNPDRFEPERHLPPRLESQQKGAFVPFGIGPHSCLGDSFSRDQMAVTLATLLHCAEFGRYPVGDSRVRITSYPSLRPHGKCRIQVKRHRLPAAAPPSSLPMPRSSPQTP